MGAIGGYTLDLYCDAKPKCRTHDSIPGTSRDECIRLAHRKGWTVEWQRRKAYCKQCKEAGRV